MRCLVTKKQSQIALGWLSLYRSTNAPGAFFSVAVISEVGDVACTLFWTDCWLHGQRICGLVPQLFTLVAYRRSNKRTVLGGGSYPRCSICWCYCQIPWALGHSLWGGFATWGRRLMYAVFLISGQHTAKSAYSLQELISGCGDIWPLGENMEIMGSREL